MTHEEIKVMIEKIDANITKLQSERHELRQQQIELFKNDAQKYVGRCFKFRSEYVKIIGVPEFDEHRFPAIYLIPETEMNEDLVPFKYDTIHSNVWNGKSSYEEIRQDEFNAEFKRRIDVFRNEIMTTGDKTCLTCRMYDNPSDFLCTSCGREYSNYEPVEDETK